MEDLKIVNSTVERSSTTTVYEVGFIKNGKNFKADVQVICYEDHNMGYYDFDYTITNEEDLPEMTEEENELLYRLVKGI